jgi:outer membrane protein OmpA-like peptidoglycan-associated protein
MLNRTSSALLLAGWIGAGGALAAQAPPKDVPAGNLKVDIRDLTYPVIDLKGGPEKTAGGASALAGRVEGLAVNETPTEVRIELNADVLFDFDKADIKPQAGDTLKKVGAILREKARGPVRIEGYTDAKGSAAYNQKLSLERAESVRRWLVDQAGLKLSFVTRGGGASNPVAPNAKPDGSDNPEGRQKNRRVEIIVGKA